jgi:hypothetical protein
MLSSIIEDKTATSAFDGLDKPAMTNPARRHGNVAVSFGEQDFACPICGGLKQA